MEPRAPRLARTTRSAPPNSNRLSEREHDSTVESHVSQPASILTSMDRCPQHEARSETPAPSKKYEQRESYHMATNTVTVIGNLVEDPELRFTPSGVAMAKIRVAVNRRWRDKNNDWQEDTSFFGGTVWRDAAENAAESLQKGARVIITGSLEQRSWETTDGDRRSVVELRIDELGPSLRWATASVTRTARSGDGNWGGGGGEGQSEPMPAAPVARDDYGPDEAPF